MDRAPARRHPPCTPKRAWWRMVYNFDSGRQRFDDSANEGQMELDGNAVVVTGGAGNIGAVSARRLGAEGARVVVSDRPGSTAAEVAGEIVEAGGTAVAHEG